MMILSTAVMPDSLQSLGLAQIMVPQTPLAPRESALAFLSGSQFFIALIAGVVLAFAFQLLLTNFSIAADASSGFSSLDTDDDSLGKTIRTIEARVGIGTLVIVNIAIFAACFLAVKLTWIDNAMLAAIVSAVIWSVYFLILMWMGSRAIASLLGSVGSAAGAGVQGIMATVATALGGSAANAQIVNTVEASVDAVTKQMRTAFVPDRLTEGVGQYLSELSLPELNMTTIGRGFETLLNSVDLSAIANSDLLNTINRDTFVNLVSERTDLSQRDAERIADQLVTVWKRVTGSNRPSDAQTELLDFIRSASPDALRSGQLSDRLNQLLDTAAQPSSSLKNQALQLGMNTLVASLGVERMTEQLEAAWSQASERAERPEQRTLLKAIQALAPGELKQGELGQRLQQLMGNGNGQNGGQSQSGALSVAIEELMATLRERVDLSDLDVEAIARQLNQVRQRAMQQAGKAAETFSQSSTASTIRDDIQAYLLNSPPWYLNPEALDRGFREVIHDPEADPILVQQQLDGLNRGYFVNLLRQREGLSFDQINATADLLDIVRQDVLSTVIQEAEQERSQHLRQRIEQYLHRASKDELTSDALAENVQALLADPDASYETLGNRLIQFDHDTLMQLLMAQRQDISQPEADQIVSALCEARDRFLNESEATWNRVQGEMAEANQRVIDYLRGTNPTELTPESIQQTLRQLVDHPQASVSALRTQLSNLNRDTVIQILSDRGDLSEDQLHRIVDQVDAARDRLLNTPQRISTQATEQYQRLTSQLADYLRQTNLEELNPEGIQRDLETLLDNPREGISSLRSRLAQVDRDTLVQLLRQRDGLSEAQINRTIDQVQEAIRRIVRAPQRFVARTRDRLRDFPTELENYLRNTRQEELNPDGIKRDLQLLLNHPRVGVENLGDRLSRIDRSTITALLSQRSDISEADANRIVDQVLSVRDNLANQFQSVQRRAQSVVDELFTRLRESLNGLDRPELSYEGIQRDLRTLFEDPSEGLEAWRDRLSQFDRDTLVAILSTRPDISKAEADRLIGQVESVRDRVLSRIDRLQMEAEKRIAEVKHQAKEQAKQVQKAVATAAWWLFGTALTSLGAAAIAGALASGGFSNVV